MKNEIVFQTPWFEIQARKSQTDDRPHYVVVPPDYVSVLALTEGGEVILVEQYRPAIGENTLEFPSGHVDPGETPEQSALKEMIEETGFRASEIHFLGTLRPDTGRLGNKLWCYFARGVRVPQAQAEQGIRVVTLPLSELLAKIRSGEFDHALHCGLLMLARMKGFVEAD